AGQGTVGLEIVEQQPDVDTVLMSIGGGGLLAGTALAIKEQARRQGRHINVIGVQAENAAAYQPSLVAGKPVALDNVATIADGIAVGRPGDVPFEVINELCDEVVTVTDDEIAAAIVFLLERSKMVVEPAGAAPVAALMTGKLQELGVESESFVAVLSGGNIDPILMLKVIQIALASAWRVLTVTIAWLDRQDEL